MEELETPIKEKSRSSIEAWVIRLLCLGVLGGLIYFRTKVTNARVTGGLGFKEALERWHQALYGSALVALLVAVYVTARFFFKPRYNRLCLGAMLLFWFGGLALVGQKSGWMAFLPQFTWATAAWTALSLMSVGFVFALFGLIWSFLKRKEAVGGTAWGGAALLLNGAAILPCVAWVAMPWLSSRLPSDSALAQKVLSHLSAIAADPSGAPLPTKPGETILLSAVEHKVTAPGTPWAKSPSSALTLEGAVAHFQHAEHQATFTAVLRDQTQPVPTGDREELNRHSLKQAEKTLAPLTESGAKPALRWSGAETLAGTTWGRMQYVIEQSGKENQLADLWTTFLPNFAVNLVFLAPEAKGSWLGEESKKVAASFQSAKPSPAPTPAPSLAPSVPASSEPLPPLANLDSAPAATRSADAVALEKQVQAQIAQPDAAITLFDQNAELTANDPALSLLKARLLGQLGRWEPAESIYEKFLPQGHGTEEDIQTALNTLVAANQTRRAMALAEIISAKRSFPKLRRWQACLQAEVGEYQPALNELAALCAEKPLDPINAYKWGEIALKAGQAKTALQAATTLKAAGHQTVRTELLAARSYKALGQFDQAKASFSTLVTQNPTDPLVQAAQNEFNVLNPKTSTVSTLKSPSAPNR